MEVINIILNFKAFDDAHKAQYCDRLYSSYAANRSL